MFVLGIKGAPYKTEFTEKRENWHIVLEGLNIRLSAEVPHYAEILVDDRIILCPLILPVPDAHVFGWQNEFRVMKDAMSNPLPENHLRAELGVTGIFRYLLDGAQVSARATPAAKLKKLIDSDTGFEKTLKQLSGECGYTQDHLRILFFKQFQISPHEYRAQKRIDTAMELMTNTEMLIKEIAWRLNFKNEAAFSAMFKKLTGDSPKSTLRKLRKTI
ncbi:MAG: helix-turn-helix transcriptional regulator [Victivallales bacterium]|nr:helix-turn-helix transcriptional regulator [Victivallales bacterium]